VAVADPEQNPESIRISSEILALKRLVEVFERRGEVLGVEVHLADLFDRRID